MFLCRFQQVNFLQVLVIVLLFYIFVDRFPVVDGLSPGCFVFRIFLLGIPTNHDKVMDFSKLHLCSFGSDRL